MASMRKFISSGNRVHFQESGGCIEHRESGAKLRFLELGSVYFLKLRLQPPCDAGHIESGFARQAP